MKKVLSYIWQLPQNLIALFLLLIYRDKKLIHRTGIVDIYTSGKMPSGISLGNYIILNTCDTGENDIYHELGHHKQSLYFGPLYLLLIGIPSLCGNIYDRVAHRNWAYCDSYKWYYNQPWEKWADKLGGVVR